MVLRLTALAVASLACSGDELPAKLPRPQSIILISVDTLRADYLNAYGYERFETSPFLDAFAAENILLENCIVAEPRTLTSHMSLFTGLHPHNHSVRDDSKLRPGIPTIASLLRNAGYATGAFVDDGYMRRRWGFDRGFDTYYDREREGLDHLIPKALEWLEKKADQKAFLFLHTYDVHSLGPTPYYESRPPFRGRFSATVASALNGTFRDEFEERLAAKRGDLTPEDLDYIRATYAEGVRFVDHKLHGFFEALRNRGSYDQSLVVISSDHGEELMDHGSWLHGQLYDHTIRVPLLIKIPGLELNGGLRVRSVASAIDIAPTILEIAGVRVPAELDGRSLLGVIRDDSGEGLAFSARTRGDERSFSVRSSRHHLIWNSTSGERSFFDLTADPREFVNLSPSGSKEEQALRRALDDWVAESQGREFDEASEVPEPLDSVTEDGLRALGYIE